MNNNTVYLLDSYALIYRSYFAFINNPLINDRGENVSALFGFFRTVYSVLQTYKPDCLIAAFDPKTPTFRHDMYDQYKATRDKTPEDLHAQIPFIKEILQSLNIPIVLHDGFEADDVIATIAGYCSKEGTPCRILSADKDLMQLVNATTSMMKSNKVGGWEIIDEKGVEREWGVPPSLMLDMLSLVGDTADNIPGVHGVGIKTATKLLLQYGSLEGIYENIDSVTGSIGQKLRNGKETAFFSRSLIALRSDVPIEKDIDSFRTLPDYKAAAKLLKQHGVPTIAKLFESASDNTASSDKTAEATLSPTPVHKVSFEEPCFYEYSQNTGDYCLIQTLEELTGIIDCAEKQAYVAFDCETDSLNTHNTNLVGFSLCLDPGKAYYIPIKTRDMLFVGQTVSKEDALRQLERIFFNRDMTLIMHNGKFDLEVLCSNGLGKSHNKGFPTCTVYDTIIAAWLLQPERESFKLENLAGRILGLQGIDFASIVSKGMTFEDVPLDTAVSYAGEDADFTLQLWNVFKPLLKQAELETLFYTLEMPVLPILAQMEMNGIKIEKHKLAEYANELEVEIAESEQSIYDAVGHEFNIASTKQLQTVLFTELQLPATKKTKTGYSTDTTVLQELAAYNPVPKKILEYRAMTKLKSTYVDALPLLADARGRIHTSFVQTGTATGRLSSRDPNLQNIPVRDKAGRRIRSAFIAPEGKMLVSADYSQIELVILAHLSNDKNLCKAFIEGIDVHRATAALIFGIDSDDVSAEQRRTAKTINFGVMYGMSSFRLANELGISRATAQEFIDSYFATYVDVQRFMHETIVKAEQTGYVETIMGRRRYIPGIAGKNKNEKAAAERIAINTPIQGSAADIVKKAMLAVHTSLQTHVPSAKLLLQVHDELIAECEEKDADKVAEIFRKEMEAAVELSIPLRVNAEIGKSWGDFH